jgi:hypothetical protein
MAALNVKKIATKKTVKKTVSKPKAGSFDAIMNAVKFAKKNPIKFIE